MKRVAIDMDGVLYDLLTPWLKEYNEIFSDDLSPEQITTYDLSHYIKCDKESLNYILERPDFWEKIELYDGVYEAIDRLTNDPEIDLLFVTATSYKTAAAKFQRILELLPMIKKENIIITGRKYLINADIFVDDWEENLKKMENLVNKNMFLITQNYNRSFPATQYGITRCNSLAEAVDLILKGE